MKALFLKVLDICTGVDDSKMKIDCTYSVEKECVIRVLFFQPETHDNVCLNLYPFTSYINKKIAVLKDVVESSDFDVAKECFGVSASYMVREQ
jgi:hypothetical protein